MIQAFEDFTEICKQESEDSVAAIVCFDPSNKTLTRAIKDLLIVPSQQEAEIEFSWCNYDTTRIEDNEDSIVAIVDISATKPVQIRSSWGNDLPNFSTNSDNDFVEDYEVFEGLAQDVTQRYGW